MEENNKADMRKKLIILAASMILIAFVTFSTHFFRSIGSVAGKVFAFLVLNLINGIIAYVAMRLSGMKPCFNFKHKKQYVYAVLIAVGLALLIGVIPALFGMSLVGGQRDLVISDMIYNFLDDLLIIGPVEELIFREYVLGVSECVFTKHKWLAVIVSSALFGLWHIINGSLVQVFFAFGIGCVFGFARAYIKDQGFPGMSLSHGLYDFLIYCVAVFVVR